MQQIKSLQVNKNLLQVQIIGTGRSSLNLKRERERSRCTIATALHVEFLYMLACCRYVLDTPINTRRVFYVLPSSFIDKYFEVEILPEDQHSIS